MNLHQAKDAFDTFWLERDPRERKMLGIGGAAVAATVLYLLAIAPALNGVSKLQKDLPQLRQQALALQGLAGQAQALAVRPQVPATLSTSESIEASLTRRGFKAQSIVVSGDLVRVQVNGASFAGLLDWIDDMQKNARLTIVESSFIAQAQTDIVNATLSLRQPKTDDRP
ncbi:MAG: type II secretion system protein M [Herminiimonas sp.]|nr:type II secretion system protein M [Herminiimonas sp.]